jgi:anti-sigma factor RsiW
MALGALYQLARTHLVPAGDAESVGRAYQGLVREDRVLALQSGDEEQLQAWLAGELGAPVNLPATPEGYRPLGADRTLLPSGPAGAIVYGRADGSSADMLVLLVHPAADASAPSETAPQLVEHAAAPGVHELSWARASSRYTLVGSAPQEELRRFVD